MAIFAKKIITGATVAAFASVAFLSTDVFATDVSDFASLQSLVASGGEAKLTSDISLGSHLTFSQPFTLDLNGHTINAQWSKLTISSDVTIDDTSSAKNGRIYDIWATFIGNGGTLTHKGGRLENDYSTVQFIDDETGVMILDGGTVAYTDCDSGSGISLNGNATLTMNSGSIISECNTSTDSSMGAVSINGGNDKFTMNGGAISAPYSIGVAVFHDSELIMNGGEITAKNAGISSNGTMSPSSATYGNNAKITVNGGTVTSSNDVGIYAPSAGGLTTINGGTITGKTGIEIRAGDLVVTGGTITGTADSFTSNPNGNGTTTTGAAIAVSQHNTKQPINVTISGGTLTAANPLALTNPQGNTDEDLAKISIGATGGEFVSTSSEPVNDSISLEKFISGGVYSNDVPANYIVDGYASVKRTDGKYEITKIHNIAVASDSINYLTVDRTTAPYKETVNINAPDRAGFTKKIILTDANGGQTVVDGDSFEMPDSDITVSVVFEPVNPATADDISVFIAIAGICTLTLVATAVTLHSEKR